MTLKEAAAMAAGTTDAMAKRDPFLAFTLLAGAGVLGWVLWQGQLQNEQIYTQSKEQTEQLITIQIRTLEDRATKTEAIRAMTEVMAKQVDLSAQTSAATEALAESALAARQNLAALLRAMTENAAEDSAYRELVHRVLRDSLTAQEALAEQAREDAKKE